MSLELLAQGQVTSASIDGTAVAFPVGKKIINPAAKGTFSSSAAVTGPGGTGTCSTSYTVDDNPTPPPDTAPTFTVVPAYCGPNTLPSTVSTVCLSVLKRDSSMNYLKVTDAILITYRDQTKEVMPIVYRATKAKSPTDVQTYEDLTLYANGGGERSELYGPGYARRFLQNAEP